MKHEHALSNTYRILLCGRDTNKDHLTDSGIVQLTVFLELPGIKESGDYFWEKRACVF